MLDQDNRGVHRIVHLGDGDSASGHRSEKVKGGGGSRLRWYVRYWQLWHASDVVEEAERHRYLIGCKVAKHVCTTPTCAYVNRTMSTRTRLRALKLLANTTPLVVDPFPFFDVSLALSGGYAGNLLMSIDCTGGKKQCSVRNPNHGRTNAMMPHADGKAGNRPAAS